MLSAFRLGWRQLRRKPTRYLLAVLGVVLGVALMFGTLVAGASVRAQLEAMVGGMTGRASVAAVPRVPGSVLTPRTTSVVRGLPDVVAAAPSLNDSTSVRVASGSQTRVVLSGLPMADATAVFDAKVTQGRLPAAEAWEAVVPQRLADKLGAGVGSDLVLPGATPVRLRIVGILDLSTAGIMAGGDLVVTSLPVAQQILGAPGAVSRVDIVLAQGRNADAWAAANRGRLPAGVTTQDLTAFVDPLVPFLESVTRMLALVSIGAGVVAAYLVFLSMSRSVQSRTVMYGVLRSVGMRRREVRRQVVVEAVVLGMIGTVVGLLLGYGLAVVLGSMLSRAAGLDMPTVFPSLTATLIAALVGLAAAVAGAWVPANEVAGADPVDALRGVRASRPAGRRTAWFGATLVAVGAVLPWVMRGWAGSSIAVLLLLVGVAMVAQAALSLVAFVLRRVEGRLRLSTRMAGLHLARDRRRAGAIVSLLTIIMAITLIGFGVTESIAQAMVRQLERQFSADVQISAPKQAEPAVARELARTPHVGRFSTAVSGDVLVVDRSGTEQAASALAIDPPSFFAVGSLPWVVGSDRSTPAELAEGRTVVFPSSMADRLGYRVGDRIRVQGLAGPTELTVVATYASVATGPQLVLSRRVAQEVLGLTGTTQWNVQADGTSARDLRAALDAAITNQPGVAVVTAADMLEDGRQQLGSYQLTLFTIVALIALVGGLGLWATLAMSVLDRSAEIGTLRALGARRRHIRRRIMLEGTTVMVLALIAATAVGLVAGAVLTDSIGRALGFSLTPVLPWRVLAVLVPASLAAAWLASAGPASRATRVTVPQSIRQE